MIIPIQREGARDFPFPSAPHNNYPTHSTSFSTKKSVRITPKITDVEILPRQTVKQHQTESHSSQTSTPVPVSILKSSDWTGNQALKRFEDTNKRWARDDIDDFVLPSLLPSRSLLKDRFDNFTSQSMMTPMFSRGLAFPMQDHPIKIETFATEVDRYVLTLNVQQFKPDELQVKVTDDTIHVTGKHEEKQDDANFSCQEYSRRHTLPPGVKADDVKCALGLSGILTISAPRKELPTLQHERSIPIKHSGQTLPAIRV